MGITTRPSNSPGGTGRDSKDDRRLRHARDQHLGFPIGSYRQPAPMLFTRDGHNVFLGDTYRGRSAFLICSGPSLNKHDLSLLKRPGILTLAVNNAATIVHPNLWCSVDDPGNFSDAIWHDPTITKFVPLCHMEKNFSVRNKNNELTKSELLVGDMPAVFGYRRNEQFIAEQWLQEDSFNWGNHSNRVDAYGNKGSRSIMYVALRLLHYLGCRRVYLLGCDFRMEHGVQNYAFEQDRSASSVRGNNFSYQILNTRLGHLKPFFEKERFEVINCTPNSGLTVFSHTTYEDAIAQASSVQPKTITTAGMYDRKAKEKKQIDDEVLPPPPRVKMTRSKELFQDFPETTLIICLDDESIQTLQYTWPTWMALKPWLGSLPTLILHPDSLNRVDNCFDLFAEHNDCEFIPIDEDSFRNRLSSQLLQLAAERVQTPWHLKLDPEAIATSDVKWCFPNWFGQNDEGKLPVWLASPWGYTKPATKIAELDDWGDQVLGLKEFSRLDLPFSSDDDRIWHDTISSWCVFVNTDWTHEITKQISDFPACAYETLLYYLAARRKDYAMRISLKNYGWTHSFGKKHEKICKHCCDLISAYNQSDRQNKS